MELLPEAIEGNESSAEATPTGDVIYDNLGTQEIESDMPTTEAEAEPEAESVRETVERAMRDVSNNAVETNPDIVKPEPAEVAAPEEEIEMDPDLFAPSRLDAKSQQMFNNLPKGLKRAFSRSIRDLESMTTRERQELNQATYEAKGISEAVQPFASSWGQQGFTVPAAIASLASAQERLTNPATKKQAFYELAKDLEIDLTEMLQIDRGEVSLSSVADISAHPQFRSLQETVNSLQSREEQAQIAAASAPIAEQMRAVQHEVDAATGNYRYPELHDDAYLDSLKPLISVLVRDVPGIDYGEALRRAHYSNQGYGASSQQQVRSPASTRVNQRSTVSNKAPQRAVSAAVTVRGSTAPSSNNGTSGMEPPANVRSAHDTTRWVLEQMRNGLL